MMTLEHKGSNLINPAEVCTIVDAGESMTPAAEGSCFELHVGTGDDSTFTINTAGISGLAVYAQHVPIEFERDTHYLYDSSGTDIEPVAQDGPKAWEWAGIFSMVTDGISALAVYAQPVPIEFERDTHYLYDSS